MAQSIGQIIARPDVFVRLPTLTYIEKPIADEDIAILAAMAGEFEGEAAAALGADILELDEARRDGPEAWRVNERLKEVATGLAVFHTQDPRRYQEIFGRAQTAVFNPEALSPGALRFADILTVRRMIVDRLRGNEAVQRMLGERQRDRALNGIRASISYVDVPLYERECHHPHHLELNLDLNSGQIVHGSGVVDGERIIPITLVESSSFPRAYLVTPTSRFSLLRALEREQNLARRILLQGLLDFEAAMPQNPTIHGGIMALTTRDLVQDVDVRQAREGAQRLEEDTFGQIVAEILHAARERRLGRVPFAPDSAQVGALQMSIDLKTGAIFSPEDNPEEAVTVVFHYWATWNRITLPETTSDGLLAMVEGENNQTRCAILRAILRLRHAGALRFDGY